MSPSPNEVSQMLLAWRNGDRDALNRLMPIVYDELRRLAHRYMNRRFAGQTLQTTALVHEAYMRLAGQDHVDWQNRSHFFAVCAQVMRNLLVDRARSRQAEKHGGGARQVSRSCGGRGSLYSPAEVRRCFPDGFCRESASGNSRPATP